MTKIEQAVNGSLLPEKLGDVGIMFGMNDWAVNTARSQKKTALLKCFGFTHPEIDHVETYSADRMREFDESLRSLAEQNIVATGRLISQKKKGENTGTIVCHITDGLQDYEDAIRRNSIDGPIYMYNTEGVSTGERRKKIDIYNDAFEGWIYSRPHSDILSFTDFQNRPDGEICETNAGGGIRMQMGKIEKIDGKTYVSFELSSAFGDASIRRTAGNIDLNAAPNENEEFYDPNKFPRLNVSVKLQYKNGCFIWPKEMNGNSEYSIEKAIKDKSADNFVQAVIRRLTETDGESLGMLFRTLFEINPIPNTLSAEVIFYYIKGELTVKVIDFDGALDEDEGFESQAKYLKARMMYKLQIGNWPNENRDADHWLKNDGDEEMKKFEKMLPWLPMLITGSMFEYWLRLLEEYQKWATNKQYRAALINRTLGHSKARESFRERASVLQGLSGKMGLPQEEKKPENVVNPDAKEHLKSLLADMLPRFLGVDEIISDYADEIISSAASHITDVYFDDVRYRGFTQETTMPAYLARMLHGEVVTQEVAKEEHDPTARYTQWIKNDNLEVRTHNAEVDRRREENLIYEIEEGFDDSYWKPMELPDSRYFPNKKIWQDTKDERIKTFHSKYFDNLGKEKEVHLIKITSIYGAELIYCIDNCELVDPNKFDMKRADAIILGILGQSPPSTHKFEGG